MRFSFSPQDIVRLIRQRLFWFAIPFALFAIIGLALVSQLPPMYQSSARLIVEGQQVPDDIVLSTIQTEAMERLQLVRAQILARENLIRLGERHGVFGEERMTRTEKDELMKDRARIVISQETLGRQRNRNSAAVVTVALSFTDPQAKRAQAVANDLLTQFEANNIELRRDQAGDTADFVLEEERKVRRSIQNLAAQIATIKSENPNALPDNRQFYESTVQRLLIDRNRTQGDLASARTALQQLQMQKSLFTSSELSPREQELADLRSALSRARQQYQEGYPTIVQLRAQVLDLEREVDPEAFRKNAAAEVRTLGRNLAETRKGTSDYEETEDRIAELRSQLKNLPNTGATSSPGQVSYNGQVFALESRLESLERQEENLERQIVDMEARIAAVPAVESQLYDLEEERIREERDLADLQSKRNEAIRSQSLEAQAKGQRIRAIERPAAPDVPTSPDKPKLALAVFALAAGLAGLLVLVPEVLFAKVQSKDHLAELLPDVPIIEVPRFKSADERVPKLLATASLTAATLVLGVALSWTAYQTLT